MSEIKDSFGNPLQINAVYSYIRPNVKDHIKAGNRLILKYLGYNPAGKSFKFQLDNIVSFHF